MKRRTLQILGLVFLMLLFSVGCDSEEELVEEDDPSADTASSSNESAPSEQSASEEADTSTPEAEDNDAATDTAEAKDKEAAEKAVAEEKAKRKKAFYGESGALEGIAVEPPAPWRRVVCDGENECVVGGDLSGSSVVQILSAIEDGTKLKLSVKGGTNWTDLGLLELFQEQVEELKLTDLGSVKDISALGELPLLTSLELSNLPFVTDLEPIRNLGKLKNFKMEGLGCVKLDPLIALSGLKELSVSMQQRVCAVDMSAVGGMGALERLILHTPNLGNIDNIAGAGALKEIFLWGSVRNLAPLAKLRNLETLTLHASPIQDLSALSSVPNLKTLKLQASHVWNYKGLRQAPKLKYLHVTEAQSLIFQNVKVLKQLDGLTLHRGKPKDWADLGQLPWLKQLDVSFSSFKDVALLKKLPKLKSFGCAGCRLKNGIVFSELKDLEEINIAGTSGGPTLIQLGQMPNLQKLTIRRRQFGRTAIRRLTNTRPQLRIIYASGRYEALKR